MLPSVQTMLTEAAHLHQEGRLEQAALLCRAILEADPAQPDALHLLGRVALTNGQAPAAAELNRRAIAIRDRQPDYHFHLALALQTMGELDGAAASYRCALMLKPDHPQACINLGNVLAGQGKLEEAIASIRRAIAITPNSAPAHNNLGNLWWRQGRRDRAETCYRHALTLMPDYADAHTNLGHIHRDKGELEQAVSCYRKALLLASGSSLAPYTGLGLTLQDLGRRDEAAACYRHVLAIDPDHVEALANLGIVLWAEGAWEEAESIYRRLLKLRPHDPELLADFANVMRARGDANLALALLGRSLCLGETSRAKDMFIALVNRSSVTGGNDELRAAMTRALNQPWTRPGGLSRAAAGLVKSGAQAPLVARANRAWPERLAAEELLGPDCFAPLAGDALLLALLTSAPNVDIALERFLTLARAALLETACAGGEADLVFPSALARQCFINDYVFAVTDAELAAVRKLRASLSATSPALQVLTVACYFPLHDCAGLDGLTGPPALEAVLTQQIREPMEEKRLAATMPRLTTVADATSRRVRDQYEEHPYPRWIRLAACDAEEIADFLGRTYPHSPFQRPQARAMNDFLVAGCGTGQHPILTALKFGVRHMLAVDLSLASLAYAQRKSQERGLAIEYGQADILKLADLGRRFDVIESIGVLHHMADPYAGWKLLLSLLRPGGVMRLGLYSAAARREISALRARIRARGIAGSAEEIRAFRQELLDENPVGLDSVLQAEDFFSVGACRDLLFHVQEQGVTLEQIGAFLKEQHLHFIGFELEDIVLKAYRQRYPKDEAATNLENWAAFEQDKAETFSGMYAFWIQKPPPLACVEEA